MSLLEKFKDKFIKNCKVTFPQWSKGISCFSKTIDAAKTKEPTSIFANLQNEPDITEIAIFQLQTIEIEGARSNLFFDSGYGDMVMRKLTIDKLVGIGRAEQILPGPIEISGVGDQKQCL